MITPSLKVTKDRFLERGSALVSRSLESLLERLRSRSKGERPTFGVALSGGSARGIAYAGVFRFFEEHNVRPDLIAGTSAGALLGAFYADGYGSEEILRQLSAFGFSSMTSLTAPKLSFLKTDKFRRYLSETLHHSRIEDLPVPMRIVATNLSKAEVRVFDRGDLVSAVAASCSIPVLFDPITIDGDQYVDGGVFMNLPARPIREECDFLLGINVSPDVDEAPSKNLLRLSDRLIRIMMHANVGVDAELCDVLIQSPILAHFSAYDVRPAEILADIGYQLISKTYDEEPQFRSIIDLLSASE